MAFFHRSFLNSVAIATNVGGLVVPMVLLFSMGACKTEEDCRPGTVLLKLACAPEAVKYEVRVVVGTQPSKSLKALEQTCTGTTSLELALTDTYNEGEAIQVFVTPVDAMGKLLPEQVLATSLRRGCTGAAAFAGDGTIPKGLDGGTDVKSEVPCLNGAVCDPDPSLCRSSGKMECAGGRSVCKPAEVPQVDGVLCGTDKVCLGGQCQTCVTDAPCELDNKCKIGKTSCTTGQPICTDTGSVAEGTACGTSGNVCLAGTCVSCQEGASCEPTDKVCNEGKLTCAGAPKCVATTTSVKNGTSCGTGRVCGDGACVACVAGDICDIPGKPCRTGVVTCNTGKAECLEFNNAPNGRTCGDAAAKMVCSNGACKECVVDKACTPANPCHEGAQTCTGDLLCMDTGKPVADGSEVCGPGKVCKAGACSACVAGGDCIPLNTVCKAGKFSCASGSQVCEAVGNASNGSKCENSDARVCANGLCTDCMEGSECGVSCKIGKLSCTGATKACGNLTQNIADGQSCGADLVCKSGSCAPCKPNDPCFPNDNRCKTGVTECSTGASLCKETGNVMDGSTLGCAAGQACTNGACAACPVANAVCTGNGMFCSDTSLVTCTQPAGACLMSKAQPCAGGCKANGANSSCCPAAPAECLGNAGTYCVGNTAAAVTCAVVDGCLKETGRTTCSAPANNDANCSAGACRTSCSAGYTKCPDNSCRTECPNFIAIAGPGSLSIVEGVNQDGSVIVGYSGGAWVWRKSLGNAEGLVPSGTGAAFEVTRSGSIIVGDANSNPGYWGSSGNFTAIQTDAENNWARAYAASNDGSVIVGGTAPAPFGNAFRWSSSLYENIGKGAAYDVSGNGLVVVGVNGTSSRGFRWTKATGRVDIPGTTQARAINEDGSIIVGGTPGFRWSQATGVQVLPGPTSDGWLVAYDLSDDGNVVVGDLHGFGNVAVVWRAGVGTKLLSTILAEGGVGVAGWDFQLAAISGDGKVVVGQMKQEGMNTRPFRAVIP